MNPDRIRAAIRMLYPDHMTPTAKNVLERILDDADAAELTMTSAEFSAKIREAQAQALETAAEIKWDGLYGEPLHAWLYARAEFVRQAA